MGFVEVSTLTLYLHRLILVLLLVFFDIAGSEELMHLLQSCGS